MERIIKKLIEYKVEKPCLKQSVIALIITQDNKEIFGSNHINTFVDVCPRVEKGCKTGEGYELCKSICLQNFHAEVDAIETAKKNNIDLKSASLYLYNHTYCCDNCISKMKESGISKCVVVDNEKVIKEYLF